MGDEFLTSYCNDYNSWLQYQTYDITGHLKLYGQNPEIEITLGNGLYKGRFGFTEESQQGYYGREWKLIAEIHIEFMDGTKTIFGTDETWTVRRSNIIFSNLYDGEHRDDCVPAIAPSPALVKDAPKGRLQERKSLPVVIHEEFASIELIRTPLDETVLDLGQNFTGIFRLKINEKAGTKVHLQFGEILQNGNFYRDNLRAALAEYIYISDGQAKIIQPEFTFYG
ncbi:MAG: family 78 glycoside hydrolase catalytic domain [Eubacteriales bacterium]|nr:family 78 glycoside hydrolase catalytic domain [Eubacteriales bacterium]